MSLVLGMQRSTLARAIARSIFRLMGWRTQVIPPPTSRYVLIGAPHTSNWDFIVGAIVDGCGKYSNPYNGERFALSWANGRIHAFSWRYSS